jgi:uracil phosphoribosyltransferase
MTIELINLSERSSMVNPWLAEMRDINIQNDPLRFRRNLERIGEVTAFEISKRLRYKDRCVETPLGISTVPVLAEQPVLATILRAGLPFHQGFLNVFDRADNAFISAFRKHESEGGELQVEVEYLASPLINGRTVILVDPMLATGTSMLLAWQALLQKGEPAHVHIAAAVSSAQGVKTVRAGMPPNTTVWVAAMDEKLDERSYIVPGLGDAGDLAYGAKD